MLDLDAFEERSAIMEFDGGMSRFEAETRAAAEQGVTRWEAINEIRKRNSARGGDLRPAAHGDATHDLPGVQSHPAKEARPMPERHVQAGRHRVDMLALRPERG